MQNFAKVQYETSEQHKEVTESNRNMVFSTKKEVFLAKAGCQVYQAEGEADLIIVLTAVRSASFIPNVLIGDDTDLLIHFIYQILTGSQAMYFYSEPRAGISKNRIWDINANSNLDVVYVTQSYLSTFLGCDSTSRVYGIGNSAGIASDKKR
ncbi:hypothetical protein QYM36_016349 [Artemia franciscana]|uniref:Uncharacterized protein n=1 Tax=Artemia franciscana TaxID=6661 RepID=A0AA88HF23_ARTSF|nr:hypothetical protein QYM36_016349 [Artemia franciscana]